MPKHCLEHFHKAVFFQLNFIENMFATCDRNKMSNTFFPQKFWSFFNVLPNSFHFFVFFGNTAFSIVTVLVVLRGQTLCTLLFGFTTLLIDKKKLGNNNVNSLKENVVVEYLQLQLLCKRQ